MATAMMHEDDEEHDNPACPATERRGAAGGELRLHGQPDLPSQEHRSELFDFENEPQLPLMSWYQPTRDEAVDADDGRRPAAHEGRRKSG